MNRGIYMRNVTFIGLFSVVAGLIVSTASSAQRGPAAEPVTLAVGISPNSSMAGFFNALDKGYFTAAGLKINEQQLRSGDQAIPLLLNEQLQVSFTDLPSLAVAHDKGIPTKFVAAAQYLASNGPTTDGLAVRKDEIKSPADLVGKTVAVGGLVSGLAINFRRAVVKAGGDDKKVKLVELPQPSMIAAVQSGKVDAAVLSEPFVTQAEMEGLQILARLGQYANPGAMTTGFATTESIYSKNPKAIQAFVTALNKGTQEVIDSIKGDHMLVNYLMLKNAKIPQNISEKMVYPTYDTGPVNAASIQPTLDSMFAFGHIKTKITATDLILKSF